jgi:hypothetical protein
LGGQQLRTTTRIKNANDAGGQSEWFYTNQQTLDRAFSKANKEYGGKLLSTHLNDIIKMLPTINLPQLIQAKYIIKLSNA